MLILIGMTYKVISERGVYCLTIRVQTEKDVNLVRRISEIARVEPIRLVRFNYFPKNPPPPHLKAA